MIGICSRCKRVERIENRKKNLCMNCCSSIRQHKRTVEGKISEEEKEKNRKKRKKHNKENKKEYKVYFQKYYQKHKEKWLARGRSNRFRKDILDYFGNKCSKCETKKDLEIHHITYLKEANLFKTSKIFCRKCHRKLHRLSEIYIL